MTAAGCFGKLAYATFSEARLVLSRLRDKGRDGLSAYHCRNCGQHHVGRRRREGPPKELKPIPDTARDSYRNRKRRYQELTR